MLRHSANLAWEPERRRDERVLALRSRREAVEAERGPPVRFDEPCGNRRNTGKTCVPVYADGSRGDPALYPNRREWPRTFAERLMEEVLAREAEWRTW
jgi:hypothetical protein